MVKSYHLTFGLYLTTLTALIALLAGCSSVPTPLVNRATPLASSEPAVTVVVTPAVLDDGWYQYTHAELGYTLTSGQKVYSVYAHLDDSSLEVEVGQVVLRGQRLAEVMYQDYTGRYPEYHPSGDDSHLHYELRDFYNGRDIYSAYPNCNGLIPGRGYTHPEIPDNFPGPKANYTDPATFIQERLATPY